jgi:hypothetical protein
MCNPTAYAVFQVASAVNDYNNASNAAKATNANSEANAARIRNEAIYSDNALIRKKERETEKTSLQKFQTNIKAKKLLSEAKVGIGEKNIGGNITDTLLGDIERQRGFAFSTIDSNYENYVRSIDENREAANRGYVNQVLALPRAVRPSFLPYALKAAGNVALTYASVKAPATPVGQTTGYTKEGINLDSLYSDLS